MGQINEVHLSKFFCGLLFPSGYDAGAVYKLLESGFKDEIDIKSGIIDFDFTSYYAPEMGPGLKRQWVSFKTPLSPGRLADIKVMTNEMESSVAKDNKRIINIDPGYITPANIILASTKDFSHRIYLSKGIYAEVTTIYKKEGFVKLPWTYPDYLCPAAVDFMIKARQCLLKPK